MNIPNYDNLNKDISSYTQLYPFMPKTNFRMLITGPSGCGKTNLLNHILRRPLVQHDKIQSLVDIQWPD